jgi:beta-phosphoglucomutase
MILDTLIFDWDATLADTRKTVVTSFHQALKTVKLNKGNVCGVSDGFIERCMGIGAAETFRAILREFDHPVDELIIKQLVEHKSQNQISLKSQVPLFPDALDLLEMLQGKVKMGLASMNSKAVIDALVQDKGLEKYFQAIVTGDDVVQAKPHPEIFLKCAQQLNTNLSNCLVIEDSLFGVKAAKTAGMKCIAVTTGVYSQKELQQENPDAITASLAQAKFYLHKHLHIYKK